MESKLSNGIHFLAEQGQFQKAYEHASFLIEEAMRTNNIELQLTSYIQRLKLHLQQQNIVEAAADLHTCEQLMNEHDTLKIYEGIIYCAAGMLNTLTNNHQVAYTQFTHAISLAYEHGDWLTLSTAYTNMSVLPQLNHHEAIELARTGVLFAHMIEHTSDLYVVRALLHVAKLYLQAGQLDDVLSLCNELEQLLSRHRYMREQLQSETLWLYYLTLQQQYDTVIEHSTALLARLKHYNQCDLYAQALELLMEAFQQTGNVKRIPQLEQQYNDVQQKLQQRPFYNDLVEKSPSHFDGLQAFKEQAAHHMAQQDGCALLLFFIQSEQPLPFEQTSAIFNDLHFFLAQTNVTITAHNLFETHKVLYIIQEGFDVAMPAIQRAIQQTMTHAQQPINILFGLTHNIEHDAYTFDDCLSLCHAYLYYNQWALMEQV